MSQDVWLVKSSGRILGPMGTEEVVLGLRSREITPLDEVAKAFGRWHYIRDDRQFDSVVADLRQKKQSVESTHTDTSGGTFTDVTAPLSTFGLREKLLAGVEQQRQERAEIEDNSASTSHNEKVYGYENDPVLKSSSKSRWNVLMWTTLVVVLCGITWHVMESSLPAPSKLTPEQMLEEARSAVKRGDGDLARKLYRNLSELDSNQHEAKLGYGFELVRSSETVEARKVFDAVLANSPTDTEFALAQLGLAQIALINDAYDDAAKNIDAGLKRQNSFVHLLHAKGVVQLVQAHPKQAAESFRQALEGGLVDRYTSLGLAEAEIMTAREQNSYEGYQNALEVLDSLAASGLGGRQEALAFKTIALIESKKTDALDAVATDFLDTDPESNEGFSKSPLIYSRRWDWNYIVRILKNTLTDVPISPRLSSMLGIAMFKGSEKLEGIRLLEEALAKTPDDKLIRANLSYLQIQLGHEDEALAGLRMALEDKTLKLPLSLTARECLKRKDFLCAEEKSKQLLARDEGSISGIAELATVYLDKGITEDANRLVIRGLQMAPHFIPLLQVQYELTRLK